MKLQHCRAVLCAAALFSCNSAKHGSTGPGTGDPGALVTVAGGSVSLAFPGGRLSAKADVVSFAISTTPITVAEFRGCVTAGACKESRNVCANLAGADDNVAECVGLDAATRYCAWVGGKLPTLAQWTLAARGSSVTRFSWGKAPATCDQHPRATSNQPVTTRDQALLRASGLECGVDATALLRTGQHPAGASSSGLEDVLLSDGELVVGDPASPFSVCALGDRGCVVFGLIPGAIDAVERVAPDAKSGERPPQVAHPYGFRCALAQEAR